MNANAIIPRQFTFGGRIVIAPDVFNQLPWIVGKPEALHAGTAGQWHKALVEHDGRASWHLVERLQQDGKPVFFAHEIVVRVYTVEAE